MGVNQFTDNDDTYIRGNSDDTLIGNISDRLKVTATTTPTEQYQCIHIPEYLKNGSVYSITVDGSVTPQYFSWTVPAGETWYLSHLRTIIIDGGTMDRYDFGSIIDGLTNGVLLQIKANGTTYDIVNFKYNLCLANYFVDEPGDVGAAAFLDESDQFRGVKDYLPYIKLVQDDFVKITVRDDLTDLDEFTFMIHKWREI